MKLDFYPMTEEDIPEVLLLEREAFGRMAWSGRDFLAAVRSEYDHPLVITDGPAADGNQRRIAAYAVLRLLGPEAEIENICVAGPHRGRGLGNALMDEMIRLADSNFAAKIFLEVRSGNLPARALYEKKEFRELSVRKGYYSDPAEDAVVMVLERTQPLHLS